jgi:hypothetical protein
MVGALVTILGALYVPDSGEPAAYQAALKRIAELERENAFLGKAPAFFAKKAHP